MEGHVYITGAVAAQIDSLLCQHIQQNVLRGSVAVVSISRDATNNHPRYCVGFRGILEELSGKADKV